MIPALTDWQRYWLEHIQACEASGKSMEEYAASQGIAVRAMFGGKKILVKRVFYRLHNRPGSNGWT